MTGLAATSRATPIRLTRLFHAPDGRSFLSRPVTWTFSGDSNSAFIAAADASEVLLEQVRILQPRLVVMGAYPHHPLRDLFATSVTRAVLDGCPVPVLIGS